MHVAARPRIPDSAALIFARCAESVPGLDRWPRGACAGDDHGRKAARATRPHFECEYQPKPESGVGVSRGRTFADGSPSLPAVTPRRRVQCGMGRDILACVRGLRNPASYLSRATSRLCCKTCASHSVAKGPPAASPGPGCVHSHRLSQSNPGTPARTARAGRLCKPVRPCCVSAWWS